jgi:hypothetical protein
MCTMGFNITPLHISPEQFCVSLANKINLNSRRLWWTPRLSSVRQDHDFQIAVLHSNLNKQFRPQFINPAFILRRFLVIQFCWCCRAGYRIPIVLLWCCPSHNFGCSYCCCFILLRLGLRSVSWTEPKVSRCCHGIWWIIKKKNYWTIWVFWDVTLCRYVSCCCCRHFEES